MCTLSSAAAASLVALAVAGCAGSGRAGPEAGLWVPPVGVDWQWQLTGPADLSVDVAVYDLDGLATPPSSVDEVHRRGARTICYVSVGTWEDFRPDAGAFPAEVLGRPLVGFPDERWLDVRRLDVLAPVLERRLDTCRDKGFDAVEPDNVDGWANDSGFPLTARDQLAFNRWVADQVHERGLSVGLKNDLDQVAELVDEFDFAVVEQCLELEECDALLPFVDAGKAVLHVEYDVPLAQLCADPGLTGFSSMRKHLDLDAARETCARS